MTLDVIDMIKPKRGRSRLGCLNCKKSKVKCDEVHPSCSRCIKRGTHCSYPVQFAFQIPAGVKTKNPKVEKIHKRILNLQTVSYNPLSDTNTPNESQNMQVEGEANASSHNIVNSAGVNTIDGVKPNSTPDILKKLIVKNVLDPPNSSVDFDEIANASNNN
jgi:hypothetical protein